MGFQLLGFYCRLKILNSEFLKSTDKAYSKPNPLAPVSEIVVASHEVEARKLEHHCPRALKVKYKESPHSSSEIHVPTF